MQDRILTIALAVARAAGAVALKGWRTKFKVETKADRTPVTAIDRNTEETIRRMLHRAFPQDALFGEEFGGRAEPGGARWIVDPIDGTKNFIRGGPYWGVLIAREQDGVLTHAVCHMPALQRTAWAVKGKGAFLNGRRLRVAPATLPKAYVLHAPLADFIRTKSLNRLARIAGRTTVAGCLGDCSPSIWVAEGHASAMIEADVKPWDLAAPRLIVEEAGGRATVWRGRWNDPKGLGLLTSNRETHAPLLKLLGAQRASRRSNRTSTRT